jgi:NAD/NADP transhydrogenase beta subunit
MYDIHFNRFTILMGVVVGVPCFTGSVLACLKLQGTVTGRPLILPFRHWINIAMLIGTAVLGILYHLVGRSRACAPVELR